MKDIQKLRDLHQDMEECFNCKDEPPQEKPKGCNCCKYLIDDYAAKDAAKNAEEWKHKLAHALHSRRMHTTATILLLIDVGIVFVDLFLECLFILCLVGCCCYSCFHVNTQPLEPQQPISSHNYTNDITLVDPRVFSSFVCTIHALTVNIAKYTQRSSPIVIM